MMRGHRTHHQVVLGLLEELPQYGVPIKVNTVVSRVNIDDLDSIGRLLERFHIRAWSLYEFWALGPGAVANRHIYELPHELFMSRAASVAESSRIPHVEIGSVRSRRGAYLFVTQTGRVSTHDRENPENYVEVGSIFEPGTLEAWARHADGEKLRKRLLPRFTY